MKLNVLVIVIIFSGTIIYPQSDKPKAINDSLSYADTVWAEIPPECINYSEVGKMVKFPDKAREEFIEGRVVIKCLVDTEGNVEKTGEITGPSEFYVEVQRVAMFLKFTPGKVNHYPVKVWVSVPFNFKLR